MNNAFARSFTHSRTILTLWYVVFCLALIALLNFGAFTAQSSSLQVPGVARGFGSGATSQTTLTFIKTDNASAVTSLDAIRQRFGYTLIIADSALFVFAIIFSYILAGFTLNPIRKIMQQQEEFAQEASHELRTPLSVIAMEVETLKRDQSMSNRDAVNHIDDEIKRMNRLVSGLLVLMQPYKDTKRVGHIQPFNLAQSTKTVFLQLQKIADSKQLTYSFHSSYKGKVVADRHDIEQVVRILLENAIKYSPKHGSVLLNVAQQSKQQASVEIIDTGPGIAKEDLPYIFDRFYRGKNNKKDTSGLGLGLAIAKKMVVPYKGSITIQSELDKGTTATIYLPIDQRK